MERRGFLAAIPFGLLTAKKLLSGQVPITTQHKIKLDGAQCSNIRIIKSKSNPPEPIVPGKIWFVDDRVDIEVITLKAANPNELLFTSS